MSAGTMTQEEIDRENEAQAARLAAEQDELDAGGDPDPDRNGDGSDQQFPEPDDAGDPQEELFVFEHGEQVKLSTLYSKGTPVEYELKLSGKAFGGGTGMGLLAFTDPERTLIVPGRAGKVEVDPTYNPDGTVKKVKVRQHFKPATAYDSRTDAGRAALVGEQEHPPRRPRAIATAESSTRPSSASRSSPGPRPIPSRGSPGDDVVPTPPRAPVAASPPGTTPSARTGTAPAGDPRGSSARPPSASPAPGPPDHASARTPPADAGSSPPGTHRTGTRPYRSSTSRAS